MRCAYTVWDKKNRDYEITHYARTNRANDMKFIHLKAENQQILFKKNQYEMRSPLHSMTAHIGVSLIVLTQLGLFVEYHPTLPP